MRKRGAHEEKFLAQKQAALGHHCLKCGETFASKATLARHSGLCSAGGAGAGGGVTLALLAARVEALEAQMAQWTSCIAKRVKIDAVEWLSQHRTPEFEFGDWIASLTPENTNARIWTNKLLVRLAECRTRSNKTRKTGVVGDALTVLFADWIAACLASLLEDDGDGDAAADADADGEPAADNAHSRRCTPCFAFDQPGQSRQCFVYHADAATTDAAADAAADADADTAAGAWRVMTHDVDASDIVSTLAKFMHLTLMDQRSRLTATGNPARDDLDEINLAIQTVVNLPDSVARGVLGPLRPYLVQLNPVTFQHYTIN
jgi:hypothetical protein